MNNKPWLVISYHILFVFAFMLIQLLANGYNDESFRASANYNLWYLLTGTAADFMFYVLCQLLFWDNKRHLIVTHFIIVTAVFNLFNLYVTSNLPLYYLIAVLFKDPDNNFAGILTAQALMIVCYFGAVYITAKWMSHGKDIIPGDQP
jgi:hypothetical protein